MRRAPSLAEAVLWRRLRSRQFFGRKFRRQHCIGPWIVDFCCVSERLIIEVDGEQHAHRVSKDIVRSAFLNGRGYRVVRFRNGDVLGGLDGVLRTIKSLLRGPSPRPSPVGGGGQ
ncbi:MAG: DUF559 domain-containing protein [Elusimicrobiota bacterium]